MAGPFSLRPVRPPAPLPVCPNMCILSPTSLPASSCQPHLYVCCPYPSVPDAPESRESRYKVALQRYKPDPADAVEATATAEQVSVWAVTLFCQPLG